MVATKQWRPDLRRNWRLREPVQLNMAKPSPSEEHYYVAREARRFARQLRRPVVVTWPNAACFGIPD